MTESTVIAKGQTTVRRQIRDSIGAIPGTRWVWHVIPDGGLIVRAKNKSLIDLAGEPEGAEAQACGRRRHESLAVVARWPRSIPIS